MPHATYKGTNYLSLCVKYIFTGVWEISASILSGFPSAWNSLLPQPHNWKYYRVPDLSASL